jgi:hypothetical protein
MAVDVVGDREVGNSDSKLYTGESITELENEAILGLVTDTCEDTQDIILIVY